MKISKWMICRTKVEVEEAIKATMKTLLLWDGSNGFALLKVMTTWLKSMPSIWKTHLTYMVFSLNNQVLPRKSLSNASRWLPHPNLLMKKISQMNNSWNWTKRQVSFTVLSMQDILILPVEWPKCTTNFYPAFMALAQELFVIDKRFFL